MFNPKFQANKPPSGKIVFDCVMRDKNGIPICFMKRENIKPNFQNNKAVDRKLKEEFLNLQLARSNRYAKGESSSSRGQILTLKEQNQKYFELEEYDFEDIAFSDQNFSDENKDGSKQPPPEFEESDKNDMDPTKDFPDEEVDYPEQDEILDDIPLREIEEPVDPGIDTDDIPTETQVPGIDPRRDDADIPDDEDPPML